MQLNQVMYIYPLWIDLHKNTSRKSNFLHPFVVGQRKITFFTINYNNLVNIIVRTDFRRFTN